MNGVEVVRCFIARVIWMYFRFPSRVALHLVPSGHPWRTLVETTDESLSELTASTLYPRDKSGRVRSSLEKHRTESFIGAALQILLLVFALYAIVDDFVGLPAIGPLFGS